MQFDSSKRSLLLNLRNTWAYFVHPIRQGSHLHFTRTFRWWFCSYCLASCKLKVQWHKEIQAKPWGHSISLHRSLVSVSDKLPENTKPEHLLWCLHSSELMLLDLRQSVQKETQRKYYRKSVWRFVELFSYNYFVRTFFNCTARTKNDSKSSNETFILILKR